MTKQVYIRGIIIFYLIILMSFSIYINMKRPRVFVVHSYSMDFSWDADITVGINRIFNGKPYKIRKFFMDTKKHPDKLYMERIGATARKAIDSWNPDIIIALDDNAQQYVAKYYINKPNTKIVFAGVNKTIEDYGYQNAENTTGVLERLNYNAVKDILLQVMPRDKRKIIHISDSSDTSHGIHNEIQSFDWAPLKFVGSIQCETMDQWKLAIKNAENGNANFILYTHYHTILETPGGKVVPPKQVMSWTIENTKLPGVSFWGFYVEDGGMMAVALSPYEQGEIAAKMAQDIIELQKSPKDIPVYTSYLFVIYMRDSEIKKRMTTLKLPIIYEAFARATNNYYE
ncbi:conserved hypothetical protein [Gammaproteobacteria bacterium]